MIKKMTKQDTWAKIQIMGDVRTIPKLKEDKNKELSLEIKIGFKGGTIFAYAKQESIMYEMMDLKIGDVISVKGKFVNIWYPTATGNFAAIDNITKWTKEGILE
ncbi:MULTISPECIES: hypothetical protein [Mesoplasma]|uniref:Uncharacterized protein n=2 Tax=Mesoplasma TaxID=46239 RepID=A0A3S5XZB3_9MOLU|nr:MULTISPECIES: hypothetical protein [Mesoplasma]ATQ35614.1 hypothetical protein CS528_02475 [Mesoplasma entomophilum]ATZ19583.1 hypothetical protein MENTO_v1c04780 [Mesoplasma entomophilum]AVN59852.1 hypothetical protein CG008_03075 [Mesoplasma florum]